MREWQTVASFMEAFADFATNHIDQQSHALTQLIGDAAVRAREALRRARERAGDV